VTAAGTVLVAHLDSGKIVEYDWNGKALWSQDLPNCFSAVELPNGNILAATSANLIVREINRKGETVWEWTAADAPEYKFAYTQIATRLPNGNTLINNWFSQPVDQIDPNHAPVQAIEVAVPILVGPRARGIRVVVNPAFVHIHSNQLAVRRSAGGRRAGEFP